MEFKTETTITEQAAIREHYQMLHAVTEYDRRQQHKAGHNPYFLGHAVGAIHRAEDLMKNGYQGRSYTRREALLACFCGRLLDKVLKAVGEPVATTDEHRRGW